MHDHFLDLDYILRLLQFIPQKYRRRVHRIPLLIFSRKIPDLTSRCRGGRQNDRRAYPAKHKKQERRHQAGAILIFHTPKNLPPDFRAFFTVLCFFHALFSQRRLCRCLKVRTLQVRHIRICQSRRCLRLLRFQLQTFLRFRIVAGLKIGQLERHRH